MLKGGHYAFLICLLFSQFVVPRCIGIQHMVIVHKYHIITKVSHCFIIVVFFNLRVEVHTLKI